MNGYLKVGHSTQIPGVPQFYLRKFPQNYSINCSICWSLANSGIVPEFREEVIQSSSLTLQKLFRELWTPIFIARWVWLIRARLINIAEFRSRRVGDLISWCKPWKDVKPLTRAPCGVTRSERYKLEFLQLKSSVIKAKELLSSLYLAIVPRMTAKIYRFWSGICHGDLYREITW